MEKWSSHLVLHSRQLAPGAECELQVFGWLFLRFQRGDGLLLAGATPQLVSEGQTLTGTPGATGTIRASRIGLLEFDYFLVQPDLLGGLINLVEAQALAQSLPPARLQLWPVQHPLASQFAEVVKLHRAHDPLATRHAMVSLALPALREVLTKLRPATPSRHTAAARVDALLQEIPAAAFRSMTAAELAQRCGCSVRHFNRLFRARFGVSLLAMQIDLRLQHACQLLLDSDAKIIEVALESGFRHVGLFNLMFRRRYNLTPSEWRRKHRPVSSNRRAAPTAAARTTTPGRQA